MRLNLSSQIVLNKVPEAFYRPRTTVERSEITRMEKVPTDIYPKVEEAVKAIATTVVEEIKRKQKEGEYCVLGLGTGTSLTPLYEELIRMHKEEGVSFKNVVVFNAYEYFPLAKNASQSAIGQLRERFLDHVDIDKQNIFSPDGTIEQERVQEHCRLYEQRIRSFDGIDIMLLGIGRMGNIATNEPGSSLNSPSRIILIDATSREEMTRSFGGSEPVPPCSITMGVATILAARKIFLTAWGEEKAEIIQKTVEGTITDRIPATFLQTHNHVHVVCDLAAASRLTRIVHPWLVTSLKWNDKLVRSAPLGTLGALRLGLQCQHQDFQRLAAYDYGLARRKAECRRHVSSGACETVPEAHHHLLAAPRRRRHLDGRNAAATRGSGA